MNITSRHMKFVAIPLLVIFGLIMAQRASAQDCQITLSDSNIDFGRIMQPSGTDAMSVGNMHALGNRVISLNAVCAEGSKMVLNLRGPQLGEQFKFANQGNISVSLSNATLDGRRVDLAQVKTPGGVPGVFSSKLLAVPGDMVIPVSGGLAAQGSVLSMQVEVRPLVPLAELRTREATTMESNLSFEVRSY